MGRLFGTDGVRGVAGKGLTAQLSAEIGVAAGITAKQRVSRPHFFIARDTRISGQMLESSIISGLCSVGADVTSGGILPTSAVAYLTGSQGYDGGIMITASHNPYEYNGIKVFGSDGYKISDSDEDLIEDMILRRTFYPHLVNGGGIGRVINDSACREVYINKLLSAADTSLEGLRIAVDCSCGSSSVTAKEIFTAAGAEADILFDAFDGTNINSGCGSTHTEALAEYVVSKGLYGGFAFDGDADRCYAVDENGNVLDGDCILAMLAYDMKALGALKKSSAVVTVMTNLGFFRFAEKNGISVEVTSVGDRHILERMREKDYNLGGEQSGHIILLDEITTGDGQLSALKLLCAAKRSGLRLYELDSCMTKLPQVTKNAPLRDGMPASKIMLDPDIISVIKSAEEDLSGTGRVLVRPSGTEPLIRVMAEADTPEQAGAAVETIVRAISGKVMQ